MIARSFILFLLLDILPFLYFYLRFFYKKAEMWKQVWPIPPIWQWNPTSFPTTTVS